MSHPEQKMFLSIVARNSQELYRGLDVLEIGSYDVNGEMRDLFTDLCRNYTGVDLLEGPSVDVVAFGHELNYDDGAFALVFSAECFEHDLHWQQTFKNMIRMTKKGGVVAFTCGGPGRPEHGTIRTNPDVSPGTQSMGIDYYKNLSAADFLKIVKFSEVFDSWEFYYQRRSFDLYFVGVKKSDIPVRFEFPSSDQIRSIQRMTNFGYSISRFPLRVLRHITTENSYQKLAIRYVKFVDRT